MNRDDEVRFRKQGKREWEQKKEKNWGMNGGVQSKRQIEKAR
jgi:hypothetical protein